MFPSQNGTLSFNQRVLFLKVVPGLCVPIGIVNLVYNIVLMVVHIKIKFWKSPIFCSYFNMLSIDVISSVSAVALYCVKFYLFDPHHVITQDIGVLRTVLFHVELLVVYASTVSTLVLVTLRLVALSCPFFFRASVTPHKILPFLLLSWLIGGFMCAAHLCLELYHPLPTAGFIVYWAVFIAVLVIVLVLALSSLFPMQSGVGDYRRATNSIVLLAILNFLCYATFGGFNLGNALVCHGGWYPVYILQIFCNLETFYSISFIFPILYSLGNVMVISRGSAVREVIEEWKERVKLAEGSRQTFCWTTELQVIDNTTIDNSTSTIN